MQNLNEIDSTNIVQNVTGTTKQKYALGMHGPLKSQQNYSPLKTPAPIQTIFLESNLDLLYLAPSYYLIIFFIQTHRDSPCGCFIDSKSSRPTD